MKRTPPKCAAWLLLASLLVSLPVLAHTLSVSHVDIVVPADGSEPQIELDLAIRDLALSLPLDANHDERVTWDELQAIREPLYAMVKSGLAVSSGSAPCTLQPQLLATRQYDDGAYATVVMRADCPSASDLKVRYGLLFDVDPQHRALVTFHNGGKDGTGIASADARDIEIGSGPASRSNPFLQFLREGIHHILIGYDHLAFLLSLLLPAALLWRDRQWQPSPGIRHSLGHVLGIVTAFTLAHSITLTLAALGWITPASRWVEAAIAASVLLAALNNVWPVVTQRVWLVGFGFGLVHGFGFAGALSELGLPTGARLASLVGFNLGVEIGQMAVVALVLPLLLLVRRKRWYAQTTMPLLSLAIAGLAAWWLWVRLRG
ncbi:HupE/UreJ family protein [Thermomonas sp.]|uniref:HupE/UreJ family protein n=1 Tax=Thermomonas sp. TaxID=1971895 RepID=UPI002488088B|nr:HupE/UreJ family protein [Thermomonas sp.]MDI1253739.1 HupE/UreJ family protein [Thermomonas sp.]